MASETTGTAVARYDSSADSANQTNQVRTTTQAKIEHRGGLRAMEDKTMSKILSITDRAALGERGS